MSSNSLFHVVNMDLIPKTWGTKLLKDIATINQASSNLREFEWINYTDISSVGTHTVEPPTKLKVSEAPSRARRILKYGDTVISSVRPNRKSFFFFRNQWSNPIASTGFAVVSPKDPTDAEYIYAVLTSDSAVKTYEAICEGGAYPAFNSNRLNEVRIPWPPEKVRNSVGRSLMNLEFKIEVNKALSKTLEDMGEALFKSWFVDFDPVKAKVAGDTPERMDAETAALFPDAFQESDAGVIPHGWNATTLGQICNIKQGKYLAPSQMSEVQTETINVPVIGANGVLGYTNKSTFDFDVPLITCRGSNCGLLQWGFYPTWISNNAMAVFLKVGAEHSEFMKFGFNRTNFQSVITGSAQPQITITSLGHLPFVLPSLETIQAFSKTVKPLVRMQKELSNQNDTLRKVREALLPRLISGELQIPDEMLV